MYHVLDHSNVVYTGDLSHSTQYVIEHYGKRLDDAIQAGIRILYTDMMHTLNHAMDAVLSNPNPWHPIEDWKVD